MRCSLWVLLVLSGCGVTENQADVAGGVPKACEDATVAADFVYPEGPYGTKVGDRFAPFALMDCDGKPVKFSDVLGSGSLALVVVAAGWCAPCVAESKGIEVEYYERYCERGLRVVQVLYEDEDGNPAGPLFCQKWKGRFGLAFPVVIDPDFTFKKYFQGSLAESTPLNILVDRAGVIRYVTMGPVPADFRDRIEGLLP